MTRTHRPTSLSDPSIVHLLEHITDMLRPKAATPSVTFSGDDIESPSDFITSLDEWFAEQSTAAADEVNIAFNCLRGEAATWSTAYKGIGINWTTLAGELRRKWEGPSMIVRLKSRLYGLEQQENESTASFILRKIALFNRLEPTTDEDTRIATIIGLVHRKIRPYLRGPKVASVSQLLEVCTLLEDDLGLVIQVQQHVARPHPAPPRQQRQPAPLRQEQQPAPAHLQRQPAPAPSSQRTQPRTSQLIAPRVNIVTVPEPVDVDAEADDISSSHPEDASAEQEHTEPVHLPLDSEHTEAVHLPLDNDSEPVHLPLDVEHVATAHRSTPYSKVSEHHVMIDTGYPSPSREKAEGQHRQQQMVPCGISTLNACAASFPVAVVPRPRPPPEPDEEPSVPIFI